MHVEVSGNIDYALFVAEINKQHLVTVSKGTFLGIETEKDFPFNKIPCAGVQPALQFIFVNIFFILINLRTDKTGTVFR